MSKKSLIRSTGVIGFATATSRILGFVRDIVIAGFFGTDRYAQAFVVAFRIPNLLRDIVGEGAANSAIVPVFTDELTKKGKKDFFKLAQVVFNIVFWALIILTAIGMLAAPIIVRLIAPGFHANTDKFQVTVTLTRVIFPFLLLVGLWAYAMGVLNSLGHFAAPAFGSCILNLSIILCAKQFGENVFGLAAGVLIGGALQFFIQLPPLYLNGWKARITSEFSHPQAKRIGKLLIPRALGTCAYQINVFISTALASLSSIVGEGAVAAIYYANRIWQLPLAIFGVALAQAALPTMSRHVSLNNMDKLKDTLSFSLRALFFILIPSSIGLMILGGPITRVLFERGAFTSYSSRITSNALFFFSIGLVACGGVKVLVNVFYALNDTKTPVKIAVASVILNIVLNVTLMWPLKLGGLALADSLAAMFNFTIIFILLEKKLGDFGKTRILNTFLRVTAASIVMGVALWLLMLRFSSFHIMSIIFTIIMGIILFLVLSYLFVIEEMKDLLSWISKRK